MDLWLLLFKYTLLTSQCFKLGRWVVLWTVWHIDFFKNHHYETVAPNFPDPTLELHHFTCSLTCQDRILFCLLGCLVLFPVLDQEIFHRPSIRKNGEFSPSLANSQKSGNLTFLGFRKIRSSEVMKFLICKKMAGGNFTVQQSAFFSSLALT